ncbi:polysaccharide biosynthesis protein [Chloroflexota bacterium]
MRIKRYRIIGIFGDLFLLLSAFALAFLLRFEFRIPPDQLELLKTVILPIVGTKVLILYFTGIYRRMWRYASVKDFNIIIFACVLGSLAATVIIFFIYNISFPRSVLLLDGLITVSLLTGIRFVSRGLREIRPRSLLEPRVKPILIVGAGDTGEIIIRDMLRHPERGFKPVGLIDDDTNKLGLRLHGVRVLGTRKQLQQLLSNNQIEEVVIAMPTISREVIRDIFFQCQKVGVKCKTLPGIYQLVDGTVSVDLIREVGVEDILGREPVSVDLKNVASYIVDNPVLVSGAGGSIGSELCRQISRLHPLKLIMVDQSESNLYQIEQELLKRHDFMSAIAVVADINNKIRMKSIYDKYKPTVLFHAAAYKHVPLMESNPIEAIKNNVFSTKTLAELAIQSGVERFVSISTDKAVEPVSVMGASKAISEKVVQILGQDSSTKFMIVRFGNVIDSSCSVVPIFRQQIAHGGPVMVTHPEMTRYFMTIPEAVQLVIHAGAIGNGGEIFVLDMGDQISILELARNMIKLSGLEPEKDIPIVFSGIRPGERLHEKLFWNHEQTEYTKHEKILLVKHTSLDFERVRDDVSELESAVNTGDSKKILEKITQMYGFQPDQALNNTPKPEETIE